MAKYEGSVPYTGFIAPADDTDTFNVTDERFNKGGYRSVINQVERLAITPERRKEGMLVKQLDTGEYWTLEGGIENINWELVEFAGADLEEVLKVESFADAFRQIYVRNAEFDNVNNLAEETLWQVTKHDSVDKWLTLDNPIPRLEGLLDINPAKQWGLYRNYYKACNIAEVDWVDNRIRYTATDETGGVERNDYVSFFNPFLRAEFISRAPILTSVGAWSNKWMQCNSIWEHSDGTYRMVMGAKGNSDNALRVGLAKSNDLVNWSWIGGQNFKYEKLDTQWSTLPGLFLTRTPERFGDDYIAMAVGTVSGGFQSGWIIFDENFNIKHKAPTQIVVPGVVGSQYSVATLNYFDGKWHAFVTIRTALQGDWKVYHVVYRDILNYVVESSQLITQSTNDKSWTGDYVDIAGGIVYKGELWCFASGTGKRNDDYNLLSNKRTLGLLKFDKHEKTWETDPRSPVLAGPIEGENWWGGDILYATGHLGGYFAFIFKNDYLYFFNSFENGFATYQPTGYRIPLTLDY